jgi:hypothetical protein
MIDIVLWALLLMVVLAVALLFGSIAWFLILRAAYPCPNCQGLGRYSDLDTGAWQATCLVCDGQGYFLPGKLK